MDWMSVFDEVYPQPGASTAEISDFISLVGLPMSAAEIGEVNARQINPYSRSDRFYETWRPFDAAAWRIPNRPLPQAYLSLLQWSNGGEFRKGQRIFQFFTALNSRHGVRAMMLAYHLPEYMPGAMPIAFDGCGAFYLLDMRQPAVECEYPVVSAHAGNLGWDSDACAILADSFLQACHLTH